MLRPQNMKHPVCPQLGLCTLSLRPAGIGIVFVQHVSNQSARCHDKEDTFTTHRRGDPMLQVDLLCVGVCVCVGGDACVICKYWWDAVISFVIKLFCACIFPLSFPRIEQGCAGRKRNFFRRWLLPPAFREKGNYEFLNLFFFCSKVGYR